MVSMPTMVVDWRGSRCALGRIGCEPIVMMDLSSLGENVEVSSVLMRKSSATTTLRLATIKLTDV